MFRAERCPPDGEESEPEQRPPDRARMVGVTDKRPHVALPTEQATKYKQNLKESGWKPQKQQRPPPEQHFDDCGDGLSLIDKDTIQDLDGDHGSVYIV